MKTIGIYNPYLETKGGGEKVCLALAESLSKMPKTKVSLITHSKINIKDLENYFNLDLSKVDVKVLNFKTIPMKVVHRLPFLPGAVKHLITDVKIRKDIHKLNYDSFINNCYQSNLPGPSKHNIYMCMFPQKIEHSYGDMNLLRALYKKTMQFMYRILLHPSKKHAIYTYDLITANSKFTQGFIKKYWGLDSTILYPICDDMYDKKLNKKHKKILNVGRFFEKSGENHHKRQDFLVESFINMPELYKNGWELHLAGSVAEDAGGLKYILSLMKLANDYPVYFHFNCSYKELKKLYNESTIYWHATGYGSDPNKHPERQEHFGISTVEAMSAKCIPVVINSAGQQEIVVDSKTGYLWNTTEELKEKTLITVQSTTKESGLMRERVQESSFRYGISSFSKEVGRIFS